MQGNINYNDPRIRQLFQQFCQMYNNQNQMNNQMPMGQMNMNMGQMNMGQFNNMGGQMPMGQMNMPFNNMCQMPMGQMNNMYMNNMFMMYMNNPQNFNNQNNNMNSSMRNLNTQIFNNTNIGNMNNPMSYSTGNVVPIGTQQSNNNDDTDKGVLPRGNTDDDNSVLPPSGDTINVKFDASTGVKKIIRADKKKTTLKQLLKMYMDKIGLPDTMIGKQIVFLYCGEKVEVESKKTLEEYHIRNMSSITVFDQGKCYRGSLY